MASRKHILFFHQNYPAQFGPISRFLRDHYDIEVTFITESLSRDPDHGIRHIQYKSHEIKNQENAYFFSKYLERHARSMFGVHQTYMKEIKTDPDIFVGHVGFGNLMFFHVSHPHIPTVGFFEHYYDIHSLYRKDYPAQIYNYLRRPLNNATQILELEYCTKGYSPTPFQRNTYPDVYQHKLSTLFDGVDVKLYSPGEVGFNSLLEKTWPDDVKIVTFVSRGLESYRGFDVFMEVAYRICQQRDDVHFVIAGRPNTYYGSEMITVSEPSFKEHVLKKHDFDLNRFHFLEWIPEDALVDLFRLSDCHFYWTVPHTLSWSFFQSMAAGALVVGSDTLPVQDVLRHQENGIMVDPDDVEAMTDAMLDILSAPERYAEMRQAARETIVFNYSFEVCLPKLAEFYLSALTEKKPPSSSTMDDAASLKDMLVANQT